MFRTVGCFLTLNKHLRLQASWANSHSHILEVSAGRECICFAFCVIFGATCVCSYMFELVWLDLGSFFFSETYERLALRCLQAPQYKIKLAFWSSHTHFVQHTFFIVRSGGLCSNKSRYKQLEYPSWTPNFVRFCLSVYLGHSNKSSKEI